jgi:hypothetical protein
MEFDLDSALREIDAPAPRPASRPAPSAVQATVDTPAPPAPAAVPPAYAPAHAAVGAAPAQPAAARPAPGADNGVFERFDNELGRLPALEDAVFASDHVRSEGPNEFVTDPMRRPAAVNQPVKSKPAPAPLPAVAPPVAVTLPEPSTAPVEAVIEVPVLLTAEQVRAGVPVRVVLRVVVKDE